MWNGGQVCLKSFPLLSVHVNSEEKPSIAWKWSENNNTGNEAPQLVFEKGLLIKYKNCPL